MQTAATDSPSAEPQKGVSERETAAALRAQYLAAQLAGDRRRAVTLAVDEALAAGLGVSVIASEVIGAAQREIGQLWQEDRINIAQEHMATAISQLALAYLYQKAESRPRLGKRILVACVEGERHEFPARLLADALDMAGFDVRFLGADVPTASLARTLAEMPAEERPHLVALSATMAFHLPALRAATSAVRAALGPDVPIAVGGHICEWTRDVCTDVGATFTAADAADMVSESRRRLGVDP